MDQRERTRGRGSRGNGSQNQRRPGGRGQTGPRAAAPQPQGGRARGPPAQQLSQRVPGAWAAAPQQRPPPAWPGAPPPTTGLIAWGTQPQVRTPIEPQLQVQGGGRASHRGEGDERRPGSSTGQQVVAGQVVAGGDADNATRGGFRGRRQIQPIALVRTKPSNIISKQGTDGTQIRVKSNYFVLEKVPKWEMYQYRIDFSPDIDMSRERALMIRKIMINNYRGGYTFDGCSLYTPFILDKTAEEFTKVEKRETGEEVLIKFKKTQVIDSYDQLVLCVINIVMRRCLNKLQMQLVKRNYFDPAAKISIPQWKVDIWPGYETAVKQHERAIMMNVDIINKIMRTDTALRFYYECLQEERGSSFNDIIGTVVLTQYNNKTYHIDDVDYNINPTHEFQRQDGSKVSYIDYYRERYKLNITDRRQPLLVSRAKQREIRAGQSELIYLVPELCTMTGMTNAQRSNYQFMSEIAKYTRFTPADRVRKLQQFRARLESTKEILEDLRQWDIQLARDIVELPARILPSEEVLSTQISRGGEPKSVSSRVGPGAEWTKEIRGKRMFTLSSITDNMGGWVVLCLQKDGQAVEQFVDTLIKVAHGMGWNLPRPKRMEMLRDDRINSYVHALDNLINSGRPQFVFVEVPNARSDRYNAIKKKCCVEHPVGSQVVQFRSVRPGGNSMSIATKVAIQMNCKGGGIPWSVNVPLSGLMVIGFDVCHDPKNRSRNYGALVATMDKQMTKYFSCVAAHNKGEEISNFFGVCVHKAVKRYYELNGQAPSKIVIYRDGLGDGQIEFALKHELEHVLTSLKEMYPSVKDINLAFIIVSKRISTRIIFDDRGKFENPPPGTVVDDVVTLPERCDFFLVSQCVRLGTVTPTSYNIIYDTTGLDCNKHQRLAHKLTHMYFNWSGTVRVPAPCQYAHKLAMLTSQSLQSAPHRELDDVLFFL